MDTWGELEVLSRYDAAEGRDGGVYVRFELIGDGCQPGHDLF